MGNDFTSEESVTSMVTSPGVDPLLGQVLDGRFKVVEPIGTGGMGRVYRAVQQPLNRAVALKVLDANYGAGKDEAFRQRFLVEAALTAKLSHPNTITVIDYGCTPNGIFYLAMEYLDGRTLDQVVMDDGPLPWRRVLHIGQQVGRSLREAHNLGVVHRDLKPANVMLLHADDDTDHVKVLDFGLVKSFIKGQELEGRAITQQGMLMGSPPYMAPEQGEKNFADPRSDIYSLGTVLYEALTGSPPFTGKSAMEVILKHVNQPVPPMIAPEPVPPEMEALVARCLAKSPMDRFQSMDEVLQAMQELATPAAFATPTGGIPVQQAAAPVVVVRSSRALPALLFLLAVVLGAIAATMILRSLRPPETAAPVVVAPAVKTPVEVVPPSREEPLPPTPEEPDAPDEAPVKVAPVAPPVEPVATRVTFHVDTEPHGAAVTLEGKPIGHTPLDVQVPVAFSGLARAEFGLSLAGHQPTTVSASGTQGRVVVKERLLPLGVRGPTGPVAAPVKHKATLPPPMKKVNSSAKLGEDDDGPSDGLKKPHP